MGTTKKTNPILNGRLAQVLQFFFNIFKTLHIGSTSVGSTSPCMAKVSYDKDIISLYLSHVLPIFIPVVEACEMHFALACCSKLAPDYATYSTRRTKDGWKCVKSYTS